MKSKMKLEIVETLILRHVITVNSDWPEGCKVDEVKAIEHLKSLIAAPGLKAITTKSEVIKSELGEIKRFTKVADKF